MKIIRLFKVLFKGFKKQWPFTHVSDIDKTWFFSESVKIIGIKSERRILKGLSPLLETKKLSF